VTDISRSWPGRSGRVGDRLRPDAAPRTLDEYIGQRELKANLSILLEQPAREGRGRHVLLHGPPGLGKTTLATIVARELGRTFAMPAARPSSGRGPRRHPDLADERDVLFIDEIHRLNRAVEEILYPAMEDFALDVMIGKGPSARSLRLSLKPFTLVAPPRGRPHLQPAARPLGATYRLDFYDLAISPRSWSGPLDCSAWS